MKRKQLKKPAASRSDRAGRQSRARKSLDGSLAGLGICISRPHDVNSYLESHPGLLPLVPRICARARQDFGPGAELALDIYNDPECDDRYVALYVRLPKYQRGITRRFDRVTEAFDEELGRSSGHLLVTTDFHPPGGLHGL